MVEVLGGALVAMEKLKAERDAALAENDRLIDDATTVFLDNVQAHHSGLDINMRTKLAPALAVELAQFLDDYRAPNYVTMSMHHPEKGILYVTVGRSDGLTPSDQIGKYRDALERAQRLLSVCEFDHPTDLEDLGIVNASLDTGKE